MIGAFLTNFDLINLILVVELILKNWTTIQYYLDRIVWDL